MWLFTRYGQFSAVCGRKLLKTGKRGAVDTSVMLIRARVREHLVNLFDFCLPGLEPVHPEILESDGTDYRFRVIVPHATWVTIATRLAEDVDYDNFKNEAHAREATVGKEWADSLSRVWSIGYHVQQDRVRVERGEANMKKFGRREILDDEDGAPVLIEG